MKHINLFKKTSIQYSVHILNMVLIKIKKKFNIFTLRELKKHDDWLDWNARKKLDQYHSQDTFGQPEKLPPGANLKKALCVCNGSP